MASFVSQSFYTKIAPDISPRWRAGLGSIARAFQTCSAGGSLSSAMHESHASLTQAMSTMLDKLDSFLRSGNYSGEPIRMFLAGGMAMHFHCGSRYTEDVDASFSARLLVPANELTVDYEREDGFPTTLYFDANYNDTFALMHPDYRGDAVEWEGIGNESRLVHLYVLMPLDLAVSKLSRFSPQDREDILILARRGLFNTTDLRQRAAEALEFYVGDPKWLRLNIDDVCESV